MTEKKMLCGRYERNGNYANFEIQPNGIIRYSWGVSGFGERGSREISETDLATDVQSVLWAGYVKTTEVPVSEVNGDGGLLLDWVAGVTR